MTPPPQSPGVMAGARVLASFAVEPRISEVAPNLSLAARGPKEKA